MVARLPPTAKCFAGIVTGGRAVSNYLVLIVLFLYCSRDMVPWWSCSDLHIYAERLQCGEAKIWLNLNIGNNYASCKLSTHSRMRVRCGHKADFIISMKWSICSFLWGSKRRCSKSRCLVFKSVFDMTSSLNILIEKMLLEVGIVGNLRRIETAYVC